MINFLFEIKTLGLVQSLGVEAVSTEELGSYSLEGNLIISNLHGTVLIEDIPLLSVAESMLTLTRLVPMWAEAYSFSHTFRSAQTGIRMDDPACDCVIFHTDVGIFDRNKSQREIRSNFFDVNVQLGHSLRKLVEDAEHLVPGLVGAILKRPNLTERFSIFALASQNKAIRE